MEEKRYGKIEVKVKSVPPGVLMNKPNPEDFKKKATVRTRDYPVEKQARKGAYIAIIDGKEQLYIPSEAFYKALLTAAKRYRSGRTSFRTLITGTFSIEPRKIPLGHANYDIDERTVVIGTSRVWRGRAWVPQWEATFNIVYYKRFLTKSLIDTLKLALEDAGIRVGILDFRPGHGGDFGRFEVEEFNVTS